MDPVTFSKVAGVSLPRAREWAKPLSVAMEHFDIDLDLRIVMFIAQAGHETMGFSRTREIWGPTAQQRGYEGRADLGNTQAGDGKRFMGRGTLMITGRTNYAAASKVFGVDFVRNPELVEETQFAAMTGAWWWHEHGCNDIADSGDFARLTRRINGGLTGLEARTLRLERAKHELGLK